MAFSGWNDAAESATTAARYLSQIWTSRPLASIDPEEFYHFGLSRPYVRFKTGSRTEREIIWPATEFSARPAFGARARHRSWASPSSRISSGAPTARRCWSWRGAAGPRWSSRSGRCSPRCRTPGPSACRAAPTTPSSPRVSASSRPATRARPGSWASSTPSAARRRVPDGQPVGERARTTSRASRIRKAALALVRRVLTLLNTEADLTDLERGRRAVRAEPDRDRLAERQDRRLRTTLERKSGDDEDEPPAPAEAAIRPSRRRSRRSRTSCRPPGTSSPRSSSSFASSVPKTPSDPLP